MQAHDKGREMFLANLKRDHEIELEKPPTWQAIQNRVIQVLLRHRAYRNKQNKTTGGGEDDGDDTPMETASDRVERLSQEAFYDQALELYLQHQEDKKRKAVCCE